MNSYRILILTDSDSWMKCYVDDFTNWLFSEGYQVIVESEYPDKEKFELCFILSYSKIISEDCLKRSKHNLVVHSSALPQGKGWSPLTWQILEGKILYLLHSLKLRHR